MAECYRDYFIMDDRVLPVSGFDESCVFKGRSLYDVMRMMDGVPLFAEKHFQRTVSTANIAGLKVWLDETEIKERIRLLSQANNVFTGNVKIVFNYTDRPGPGVFLVYFVPHRYPSVAELSEGVEVSVFRGERDKPNAKLIDRQLRMATEQAKSDQSVYEVILVDRNGFITEGSRTNVFFIEGDQVFTTPLEDVLPGVTRSYVSEICSRNGVDLTETKIRLEEAGKFDAFFISGTSPGVLPVRRFENRAYPVNNPILQLIIKEFELMVTGYISEHKQ
jgi:branched-chain amino acid aminotransferase